MMRAQVHNQAGIGGRGTKAFTFAATGPETGNHPVLFLPYEPASQAAGARASTSVTLSAAIGLMMSSRAARGSGIPALRLTRRCSTKKSVATLAAQARVGVSHGFQSGVGIDPVQMRHTPC